MKIQVTHTVTKTYTFGDKSITGKTKDPIKHFNMMYETECATPEECAELMQEEEAEQCHMIETGEWDTDTTAAEVVR